MRAGQSKSRAEIRAEKTPTNFSVPAFTLESVGRLAQRAGCS